jgi:hypothetical protein
VRAGIFPEDWAGDVHTAGEFGEMKGIANAAADGIRRRENEDGGLRLRLNPPYGL